MYQDKNAYSFSLPHTYIYVNMNIYTYIDTHIKNDMDETGAHYTE